MTYEEYRTAKIEAYYDAQLQTLLMEFDPARPTVVLLPGGMGSQLERTEYPFGTEPNVINDVLWIDLGILGKKDALKLPIELIGGTERDKDSHVIAAHGPLKFLTQTPYQELRDFAAKAEWNYCVFGFDWRRPLEESATYFSKFIYQFQKEILTTHNVDPIPNTTIVCHSMGGLVCTYALRSKRFSGLGFRAVVTIATPFYGTSSQQDRYYRGDGGTLNKIYGAAEVARITSTLPGPYTLMFLPKETYKRDGHKLGLSRFPESDPNGNTDADPYDAGFISRWPKAVKQHQQLIDRARAEMIYVSQPIDPAIASAFFNVRSSLDASTAVEILWSDVDGDRFVVGVDPSPIAGIAGPGDGTVPAWSAWHAYSVPRNRHELKQAKDHGTLLEHDEVLALIASIVSTRKLPARIRQSFRQPAMANPRKVAGVIQEWVGKSKSKKPLPRELFEKPVQRAIVAGLMTGPKPRMLRRPKIK